MAKVFIGCGYNPKDSDAVINCGEYPTQQEASDAVEASGLKLAEIETEYRSDAVEVDFLDVLDMIGRIDMSSPCISQAL